MGLCPSVGVFFPPLLPLIRSTITTTDYSRSSYLQRHTEAQELGSRADYNTRRLQLFGDVAGADQAEDHCKHLSAHLVTGDGREDAVVRPGYQLSVTISNISTFIVYIQPTVKRKIVLHGGRLMFMMNL